MAMRLTPDVQRYIDEAHRRLLEYATAFERDADEPSYVDDAGMLRYMAAELRAAVRLRKAKLAKRPRR